MLLLLFSLPRRNQYLWRDWANTAKFYLCYTRAGFNLPSKYVFGNSFLSYTARGNKYTSRISKELCQSQEKFVDCLNRQAITLWVHTIYGERKQLPAQNLLLTQHSPVAESALCIADGHVQSNSWFSLKPLLLTSYICGIQNRENLKISVLLPHWWWQSKGRSDGFYIYGVVFSSRLWMPEARCLYSTCEVSV